MNILGKARRLETIIARTFNDAAQRMAPSGSLEPLEIVHAILDVVEDEIEPAGRGTHVFPFNRVKIAVVAPSREARARLEAVLDGSPSLRERLLDRLRAAGCDVAALSVKVSYVHEPVADWRHQQFHVEFARAPHMDQAAPSAQPPRQRLQLVVLSGTVETGTTAVTQVRTDIGRCQEVRDDRHHLIRTNHIAFADDEAGVNGSVSRCHAHVEFDERSGDYRVYDDRSAHGTGVVRRGRTIPVRPGSHGVRLLPGDEIALGEARLRVDIVEPSSTREPAG
jgi:hypothetical protein